MARHINWVYLSQNSCVNKAKVHVNQKPVIEVCDCN